MTASIATSTTPTAATPVASSAAPNALTSLTSNFNSFLNLLLTQLKNQDPSSPMDANTFTTELVQFSSVEQQITTNSSLTSLIQATQGSEVIQATGVVGKQVTLNSRRSRCRTAPAASASRRRRPSRSTSRSPTAAAVDVRDASLTSTASANSWAWDGKDNSGTQLADGAYTATVTGNPPGGTATAVPFTVTGTATGVVNSNGAVRFAGRRGVGRFQQGGVGRQQLSAPGTFCPLVNPRVINPAQHGPAAGSRRWARGDGGVAGRVQGARGWPADRDGGGRRCDDADACLPRPSRWRWRADGAALRGHGFTGGWPGGRPARPFAYRARARAGRQPHLGRCVRGGSCAVAAGEGGSALGRLHRVRDLRSRGATG